MRCRLTDVVAKAFRRAALPLAAYYTVTLALPILNGATQSGRRFVEYAFTVAVVPLAIVVWGGLVIGAWSSVQWVRRAKGATDSIATAHPSQPINVATIRVAVHSAYADPTRDPPA